MGRLNSGAPFLNSHNARDLEDVLGVVERAWLDGQAKATIRFHDDSQGKNPKVQPLWRKIVNKIIRNISVGYIVHQFQDVTKKDSKLRRLLGDRLGTDGALRCTNGRGCRRGRPQSSQNDSMRNQHCRA
jgi:hypothetical protein